jgi:NADPH-dependent F420 reductase
MTMRLAIIGVGNVGTSLARAALAAGHEVTLAAKHAEHAEQVAGEIGAGATATPRDAADGADVVVLAVPYAAATEVVRALGDTVAGKTVVDAANPLNETYTDLVASPSAAEQLQQVAPRAKVVKAFNTIFASRHGHPSEDGLPLDAYYCGDDEDAKGQISELASSLGYRPLDIGALSRARALEEMAFVNISLNARNGWPWQTGWKLIGPTA